MHQGPPVGASECAAKRAERGRGKPSEAMAGAAGWPERPGSHGKTRKTTFPVFGDFAVFQAWAALENRRLRENRNPFPFSPLDSCSPRPPTTSHRREPHKKCFNPKRSHRRCRRHRCHPCSTPGRSGRARTVYQAIRPMRASRPRRPAKASSYPPRLRLPRVPLRGRACRPRGRAHQTGWTEGT